MLSNKTKNILQKEKRELLDQLVLLKTQIDGLKNHRDEIVAKRDSIETRIQEINGDLS